MNSSAIQLNKQKAAEPVFVWGRKWLIGVAAIGLCACLFVANQEQKQTISVEHVDIKLDSTPPKPSPTTNNEENKQDSTEPKNDSTQPKPSLPASKEQDNIMQNTPQPKESSRTDEKKSPTKSKPVSGASKSKKDAGPSAVELASNLQIARTQMLDKLKVDYGTYFDAMFMNNSTSRGRVLFQSPSGPDGPSWDRLKRRLMIKLLLVMTQPRPKNTELSESTESSKNQVTFIWASGGHSSAAGHGNFYHESYTATMESRVKDMFAAVGIDFQGKNYAMGGTQSSPEIASCVQSVFGYPDVLSWDFGMTDGNVYSRMSHYCLRGALSQSQAACVGYQFGLDRGRVLALEELEKNGATTFYSDENVMRSVSEAIPDSALLSEDAVNGLPPLIRYFKCGGREENGDPLCGAQKFNDTLCPKRRFKTSWHPGWKWHALRGNLLALFLAELLDDAMKAIASEPSTLPADLLKRLQIEQGNDYSMLQQASLPQLLVDRIVENEPLPPEERTIVFKGESICHTAKLPAEIRFQGILTESNRTGFYTYDDGFGEKEVEHSNGTSSLMRLVRDEAQRQICPVQLNVDYKDYFFVNNEEGVKSLLVPNDAELRQYAPTKKLKGIVGICMAVCDWNKCPEGMLLTQPIIQGAGNMEVNGVKVTAASKIDTCDVLKHAEGFYFNADANGQFKLNIQVLNSASYVKVGSMIVW